MKPNSQDYLVDLLENDLLDMFSFKLPKDEIGAVGNVFVLKGSNN